MDFDLFLHGAQVFDTFGKNPHDSEGTGLMLQQWWKVPFVTAMFQPVQLVLCVLLLNLRFRRLWLIYSSVTTSHYGAGHDILKTTSDSDGAENFLVVKLYLSHFQATKVWFPIIWTYGDSGVGYHLFLAFFFIILVVLKCVLSTVLMLHVQWNVFRWHFVTSVGLSCVSCCILKV